MSQFSMSISDEAGAAFLSDVNSAIQALASNSSGTAAPGTTYAYMMWADTTTGIMKIRNAANSAWVELFKLAGTADTFTPTVTLVGGAGNTVPVYSTNTGRYFKAFGRCFVDVLLTGDGGAEGAGSGAINIALPVSPGASAPAGGILVGTALNGGLVYYLYAGVGAGSSTISLAYQDLATYTATSFTGALQNNTTRTIRLQFNYEM